jgi:hypothetical protein
LPSLKGVAGSMATKILPATGCGIVAESNIPFIRAWRRVAIHQESAA